MRAVFLLSFGLALTLSADAVLAQAASQQKPPAQPTQTAKPPAPATTPPAQTAKPPAPATAKPPAPAVRRPAAPPARAGMAMIVVDSKGGTIPDVKVEMTGPTPRDGVTDAEIGRASCREEV